MAKTYHVIAVEFDEETGEEREVLNEEYNGFTLYGDCGEKFSEVMIHENLMGLASKLSQGDKSRVAIKLAQALMLAKESFMGGMEDDLLNAMLGGNDE